MCTIQEEQNVSQHISWPQGWCLPVDWGMGTHLAGEESRPCLSPAVWGCYSLAFDYIQLLAKILHLNNLISKLI